MKVFISWSGSQSRAIAEAFRDFIGNVIQNVTPFMSSHDIEAGSRWQGRLAKELAESVVGVLCLTPDNLGSQWVLFEAGALAKTPTISVVCPYLYGLSPSDLASGPLGQFQANAADIAGTKSIVLSINNAMNENAIPPEKLDKAFNAYFGSLQEALAKVPKPSKKKPIDAEQALKVILDTIQRSSIERLEFAPTGSSRMDRLWRKALAEYRRPFPNFRIGFRGGPLDGRKIAPSDEDPFGEVAKSIFRATSGAPPLTRFIISVRQNGITVHRCFLKKRDKEHYGIQAIRIMPMPEPWYDAKYEIASNISNVSLAGGETQMIDAVFVTDQVAGEILPKPDEPKGNGGETNSGDATSS